MWCLVGHRRNSFVPWRKRLLGRTFFQKLLLMGPGISASNESVLNVSFSDKMLEDILAFHRDGCRSSLPSRAAAKINWQTSYLTSIGKLRGSAFGAILTIAIWRLRNGRSGFVALILFSASKATTLSIKRTISRAHCLLMFAHPRFVQR